MSVAVDANTAGSALDPKAATTLVMIDPTTPSSSEERRMSKLQQIYEGLADGTMPIDAITIRGDHYLGKLSALTEYIQMCDLPMRPHLHDLVRTASRSYKAHTEASFMLACLNKDVVERPQRVMIWLGLSERRAEFVEAWEKKLHEISRGFLQLQHDQLQREEHEYNHARSLQIKRALLACGMNDDEFAVLWRVLYAWKEAVTNTGMASDRLARCVASYGSTVQQRIESRGKPPATFKQLANSTVASSSARASATAVAAHQCDPGREAVKEIWHGLRRLSE